MKLSRLLLVSDRDWRKLRAEAGAEAARKVARRNLNFSRERLSSTQVSWLQHLEQCDVPQLCQSSMGSCGYGKDWILIAGRSKQVADDVGGTVVFLALPLKFNLSRRSAPATSHGETQRTLESSSNRRSAFTVDGS